MITAATTLSLEQEALKRSFWAVTDSHITRYRPLVAAFFKAPRFSSEQERAQAALDAEGEQYRREAWPIILALAGVRQ